MKKISAIVMVIVLAGTAWLGLRHAARIRLDEAIAHFRSNLPPGESFEYSSARPRLLARGASFTNVTWQYGVTRVTAGTLQLGGLSSDGQGKLQRIGSLRAEDVNVVQSGVRETISHVRLRGLDIPSHTAGTFTLNDLALLSLESGALDDVKVEDPAHGATMAASNLSINDFGQGLASGLMLRKVDVLLDVVPKRHISLLRGEVRGVHLADGLSAYLNGKPVAQLSGHSILEFDQFAIDGDTPLLRVENARLRGTASGKTTTSSGMVHGLEVWPMDPGNSVLSTLGYDHFKGDISYKATGDMQAHTVNFNPIVIDAPDMGHLEITGDYDSVFLGAINLANSQIRLVKSTFRYKDSGLVGHFLDGMAKAKGLSPEVFRANLASALTPEQSDPSAPLPTLARYLQNPGHGPLVVSLQPKEPVNMLVLGLGLAMAANPDMAKSVGLSITAP